MNALIHRRRAPRPLGSVLVRALVPRALLFAAVAAALLVGNVMSTAPSAARLAPTYTQPTWSVADRAAEPDCVPSAAWPKGAVGSAVVVHRYSDGATVRVPFPAAWAANHNATEVDDLWVLGVCP